MLFYLETKVKVTSLKTKTYWLKIVLHLFKFQAEPFRFGILSTNFDFCEPLWIQKKLAQ